MCCRYFVNSTLFMLCENVQDFSREIKPKIGVFYTLRRRDKERVAPNIFKILYHIEQDMLYEIRCLVYIEPPCGSLSFAFIVIAMENVPILESLEAAARHCYRYKRMDMNCGRAR